tara:strand:- start:28 stop:966 length:939 start_codon:yes stop_codon:yes gene_type:complete
MNKNPINYIVLEGPDLSGKTTLYNKLHKASNYCWNIQDRSWLSMLIHAKQYGRDTFNCVENLKKELYCLNNIVIILLPEWRLIADRFAKRGDEIQNIMSLKKVYAEFEKAAEEFESFPNVIVIRTKADDMIINYLVDSIRKYENQNLRFISKNIIDFCNSKENQERVGLNFTVYDDGNFDDVNENDLLFEKEELYYKEIRYAVLAKISDELNGSNEYNRCETKESRRFIYTSDTCISLAHFLMRDGFLDCKFFIRSSDVQNILYYDLNFLKSLVKTVYDELVLEGYKCRINVMINSAHIPVIIDSKEEKNES